MAPAGVIMAMTGQAIRPEVWTLGMEVFFTAYYATMLVTPPIAGAILGTIGTAYGPIWLATLLSASVIPNGIAFQNINGASRSGPEREA